LSAVPEAVLWAPSTPDQVTARGSSAGRSRACGQSHRHGICVTPLPHPDHDQRGIDPLPDCRRVPGRCCWSGGLGYPVSAGAMRPATPS